MAPVRDEDIPADLPQRVDSALQALWRGDSAEFDRLLDSEGDAGPGIGELLESVVTRPPAPLTAHPPSQVNGYTIIREIGRGGMGMVYEAEQAEPRRRVALKLLAGPCADEHHVKLFRREIRTLARLEHPAIATIYDAGHTQEGQHFFTMELVRGQPLNAYIRQARPSRKQRLELVLKICQAVQYAHEHGVVHRDLKPSNIIIDQQENPKILDFGLARLTGADVTLTISATQVGQIVGTLAYMSPEQASGQPEAIDARTDVYSLGVVLYELLTDQLPYALSRVLAHEAAQVIREQPPRRPSDVDPTLRGELETIVLKALAKDPAERYESAAALGEDIRRYAAGEPIHARPPSGLYVVRKKLVKHRGGVLVTLTIVLLALLSLGAGAWWRQRSEAIARLAARREIMHKLCIMQAGSPGEHMGPIKSVHDQYTDMPEARLALAQALYRTSLDLPDEKSTDILREAMSMLTNPAAVQHDPWRWTYDLLLAEIYEATDKPQEAEHVRARALSEASEHDTAEAWYVRSFATFDIDSAIECAQLATARDPGHGLAWERLANLCYIRKDWPAALAAVDKAIAHFTDPSAPRFLKGHILARMGRYHQAIAEYEAVGRVERQADRAWRCRGVVYLCLRQYAAAEQCFSKTLAVAPHHVWTLYLRAAVRRMRDNLEGAKADYESFRRGHRVPSYANARLYVILREQGQVAEADRILAEACRPAPKGWLAEVFACLRGETTPEQLIAAADADDLEHLCEAYYYAGEAHLLHGQTQEARACFAQCVDTDLVFDPDSAELDPMNEYHLARWRLDQMKPAEATTSPSRQDEP